VRRNLLTATIAIPANAGLAIETMVKSINTGLLPLERTFTVARPFPSYEVLVQAGRSRAAANGK